MWPFSKKPRSALILGDSHVHALMAGLKKAPSQGGQPISFEISRLSQGKANEKIPGMPMAKAHAKACVLGKDDLLVFVPRGNHYNSLGLLQHPQPFDVLADGADPVAGAQIIPQRQLEDFFEVPHDRGYGAQILSLSKASRAKPVVLEIPPPKEDDAHIMAHAETAFAKAGIKEIGVTDAGTRLRLWQLQQDAVRRFCAAHDLVYLPRPEAAVDPAGFLRRDYYANDATHANAEYGRLVLDQLVDLKGGAL